MTTREALEAALVADPDDVVRHAAYADYLLEQGDPRGEFIRLQLAAEDRNQPVAKLRELEDQAHKIRQEHEQEWLGDLWQFVQRPPSARSVAEPMEPNVSISWKRGWIDSVRVGLLRNAFVTALATHRLSRLLGGLSVQRNQVMALGGSHEIPIKLSPLIAANRFSSLRWFEIGSTEEQRFGVGRELHQAVEAMVRLESIRLCVDQFSESGLFSGNYPRLHTIDITYNNPRCRFYILGTNPGLPNLRRLSLDTVAVIPGRGELGPERESITPTDLAMFFRTKHLKSLEYFTFRNGEFGDAGVEELLASGFITRLKGLDLCRCNITDDGAQMLAGHPHVRNLEYLHLDNNLLSPIGLEALEAVGHQISPNQMFMREPEGDPDLGGGPM